MFDFFDPSAALLEDSSFRFVWPWTFLLIFHQPFPASSYGSTLIPVTFGASAALLDRFELTCVTSPYSWITANILQLGAGLVPYFMDIHLIYLTLSLTHLGGGWPHVGVCCSILLDCSNAFADLEPALSWRLVRLCLRHVVLGFYHVLSCLLEELVTPS